MSELALKLIAENKKTKATFLDLGNCGLTEVPEEIGELVWLELLTFSSSGTRGNGEEWESSNQGKKNEITTLPVGLANLKNLKILILQGNPISDLSSLAYLNQLKTLDCFGTEVSDLEPLAGLSQLKTFDCFFSKVSDLAPLAGLSQLQTLMCIGTKVSDLAPLAGLSQLKTLNCSSTQVSDLTPLAGLSQLKTLDCSFTQVSDLAPLLPLIKNSIPVTLNFFEDGINVEDCPLTNPPPEIVKQGNEAILGVCRSYTHATLFS